MGITHTAHGGAERDASTGVQSERRRRRGGPWGLHTLQCSRAGRPRMRPTNPKGERKELKEKSLRRRRGDSHGISHTAHGGTERDASTGVQSVQTRKKGPRGLHTLQCCRAGRPQARPTNPMGKAPQQRDQRGNGRTTHGRAKRRSRGPRAARSKRPRYSEPFVVSFERAWP
jgi:hypothetical protein